jgi:DNA recombination protein RmuC
MLATWIVAALLLGLILGGGGCALYLQRRASRSQADCQRVQGELDATSRELSDAKIQLELARTALQAREGDYARAEAESEFCKARANEATGAAVEAGTAAAVLREEISSLRGQVAECGHEIAVLNAAKETLGQQLSATRLRVTELEASLAAEQQRARNLQDERAQLREKVGGLEELGRRKDEELAGQRTWIEEQSKNLQGLFEKTARALFEEKSKSFVQSNRDQIATLITPFQEQIGEFRRRIDELHTADTGARAKLEQQISALAERASEVGTTANNLANAMLGNAKKQGDWGELQLNVLLEQAGFMRGKHFDTQVHGLDENEDKRIADTVLLLPDDECLIIDAKLTLPSWVDFCAATSADERTAALAAIVSSMRKHVADLAAKDYPQVIAKGRSIPFTLMFVPIEAAGIEAFRAAPELFSDAQRRKIVIVSPTTIFCVFQLVQALWNIHDRQINSIKIADEGRKLLAKLGTFIQSFEAAGKSLQKAAECYDQANGQLQTGRGNLLSIASRMSAMGVEAPARIATFDEAQSAERLITQHTEFQDVSDSEVLHAEAP